MKIWTFCQSVATVEEMPFTNRALFVRHKVVTSNFNAAMTVRVIKSPCRVNHSLSQLMS